MQVSAMNLPVSIMMTDDSIIRIAGMALSDSIQRHLEAPSWMKTLSRVGYGGKGVVYLVLGYLAMQGVAASGKDAALSKIAVQPFGRIMLGLVAIGLLAYAIWRLVGGLVDPHDQTDDGAKGAGKRLAYVISGLAYGLLAMTAAGIAMGSGGSGGGGGGGGGSEDGKVQSWTGKLLQWEYGSWLVGLVALGILVAAIAQLKKAWTAEFRKDFRLADMSSTERTWATRAGRAGHAARALVYALIAWFLATAALTHDADQAGGLGKSLDVLQDQPYGPWLLAATGFGFICYGLYCFVVARYRSAAV